MSTVLSVSPLPKSRVPAAAQGKPAHAVYSDVDFTEKAQRIQAQHPRLTDREITIGLLLAQGLTTDEIAQHFCRSSKTIEYHRTRLLQKLGVRNASQATWLLALA
jgi:DNA-binding NarL/FixJ family response regulator